LKEKGTVCGKVIHFVLLSILNECLRGVWRYQRKTRIRKYKKDRQHNGQKKKDKRTNNDLQNIHLC